MFVLNFFIIYDGLTRVHFCNTYINILCIIFVLFDKYKNFLTTKISWITVTTPFYTKQYVSYSYQVPAKLWCSLQQ